MFAAVKVAMTLTVLPLGDSITEGVPTADGYRALLRQQLGEVGMAVNYVGSLRSPAGAHEGWSGYTAGELLPQARAALERSRPDVVLLHIGTNDLGLGVPFAEASGNVRRLLELIDEPRRRGEPPIRTFLAKIIGRNLPHPFHQEGDREVAAFNDQLVAVAEERRRAGQPIEIVDLNAILDPRRHLEDALHPNPAGYARLAEGWAAAIRRAYAPRPNTPKR